ncbi:zinc finger BED domain-containing protein 4 [Cyprinodon tularosa]|uniref:zinc finger BED domain-containing protein 4 n=1 Tax=Cyprinodon tularosa TaxID=77115 RepID=UPI0018E23726|nr:zinc finger BED domain-containing protein 4 [Cyprinodon tularosa]
MASVSKVSILDYFNIVFEGENGKIESNCKSCGTRIQAKRSVTSNFVTHLKRKHPAMYDDFVKRKDMKREGYSSACLHTFATNGGNPRFTLPVTTGAAGGGALGGVGGVGSLEEGGGHRTGVTKFDRHDPRQVLISEAITKMIVHDLQPVSIVENQGFRELLQLLEPRYTPEPQHYIQGQLLPAYAYQAQLATRQAIASAHALSLSLDLWRSQTQTASGYLGVTCHYLASDWQIRSALLACLPLTCSSSVRRVLADFDEVCHSHSVSGRAFCVVADPFPATTTVRPCCLPGFLVPPLLSNRQDDDLTDQGLENGSNAEQWISNGHACNGEDEDWGESWEQGLGVCRVDCFSRSLEQCVREGLCSSPQISSTLSKVARFYNYITSAVPPEKLMQVFEGWMPGGSQDIQDTSTDWAAQHKVLRRLLDSVEFLEEISGPGEMSLSGSERALLRELVDILEPFTEAWDMVHGDAQKDTQPDRHVSISLALPCVLGLRKHLSETSTPHCPALLLSLSQSLERILAPILEKPLYITATTLDPQFKLTWSSNPEWHKQVLIGELSKHTRASPQPDLNTDLNSQSQTIPTPAQSPVSSLSRPCKLFSFIKQRPATQAKSLEQELCVYLREEPTDEEALHYWCRKAIDFPLLAQVAKRAFTIPARDTVVENIFSTARRFLLPERGHILPKNLETLIYLKANYKLLWT